ncbi:hypothetical protein X743_09590 [Mesorhizobium sp. LNHC252B00]|nr:hypothetical protein X743_09590 [Mesorhizobium sp. LNHC252B00]
MATMRLVAERQLSARPNRKRKFRFRPQSCQAGTRTISVVAADTVSARKLPIIETIAYGYFPL